MFCPHCGELAPPGPLDVRESAPQSPAGKGPLASRLLGLRWVKIIRGLFQSSATSTLASSADHTAGLPRA